jgi:hypothetical protein
MWEVSQMSKRNHNPRRAKIHRNYTVAEVAALFGVHRQTVRRWIRNGLLTIDDRRPTLILGSHLVNFLRNRRQTKKQRCKPGEIYCVGCREPKSPAGGMADYEPQTETLGNLIGLCPDCDSLIYRRMNVTRIDVVRSFLSITMLEAVEHILSSNNGAMPDSSSLPTTDSINRQSKGVNGSLKLTPFDLIPAVQN